MLRAGLRLCLCLGLALATPALASEAADGEAIPGSPELAELMAALAASGGVRARFIERKHLGLLAEPLQSEGELYFAPPDRLARVTTLPEPSRLVIDGDRLVLRDASGEERLDLRSNKIARHMVDNVMVVFRGDLETLRERYRVAFGADADHWHLRLEPRKRSLRRVLEAIELDGQSLAVSRMELRETNGDRTETVFSEVETGVDFSAAEQQRLFALDVAP